MKFYVVEEYTLIRSSDSEHDEWMFENKEEALAFFEKCRAELAHAYAKEVHTHGSLLVMVNTSFVVELNVVEGESITDTDYEHIGMLERAEYTYDDFIGCAAQKK